MNSFELNKIAGAILFALVAFMGLNVLTEVIFAPHEDEKRGFEIEVAGADDGAGDNAAEEAKVASIEELLATASVEAGARQARKCAACHSFDQGGPNKVGPALWGVVGRAPATHAGFSYSSAMREFGTSNPEWTFEQLNEFVKAPRKHVSGTSMGYAGMKKDSQRADLIAYLRSLSDNPVPIN
ncbi:Cytochrome c2 [Pseudovibrio axinellae]|uniref:Cytochrome c2 n=1 Tax=Pseudovibrio axinellae TaxID=989403 RepID=A0A165Z902_9HYPH|nr:cytochrome c family protein [Pseudovibrio axinellae]KZL19615.1 Cytochrome c2 [Pseudovibrio axinellae]SEQ34294.1 cytochrome c [Pseudovibrio axinellae]